jgi:predicted alpha/beta-fold hydrolase
MARGFSCGRRQPQRTRSVLCGWRCGPTSCAGNHRVGSTLKPDSAFRPAWWLPGPHLQTLFPQLFRKQRQPLLTRERIELDDGDFLDIDWSADNGGPIVLLLHGLEGSIRSHYATGLIHSLTRCGCLVVLLNFRGCSGESNRLPRSYHSGDTGDVDTVLRRLVNLYPQRFIYTVGISLGGNVLLKWLGENPEQTFVRKAVAVSVPFTLDIAAHRLERGLSRLYQAHLLNKLRRSTRSKAAHTALPIDISRLSRIKSFRQFDDQVTAPLHGFDGVDDYYRRASSRPFIKNIRTPTLILHALDDPFMTPDAVPEVNELGPGVQLELSAAGGHVGFVGGILPWKPRYWIDERVCAYFQAPGLKQHNT